MTKLNTLKSRLLAGFVGGIVVLAGGGAAASAVAERPERTEQAAANVTRVEQRSGEFFQGQSRDAVATCPAGTTLTGGGYYSFSADVPISFPRVDNAWLVRGYNNGGGTAEVFAYALCLHG